MPRYNFKVGDCVYIIPQYITQSKQHLKGVPLYILGFDDYNMNDNTVAKLGLSDTPFDRSRSIFSRAVDNKYLYKLELWDENRDNESALPFLKSIQELEI